MGKLSVVRDSDGEVEFRVGANTIVAAPGTTVHVPAGVVHAVRVASGRPARMLMIYAPGGFDEYLERLAALSPAQSADPAFMKALDERYDLHKLEP